MKQVEYKPQGRYAAPRYPTLDDVKSGRAILPHPTSGKKIALAALAAALAGMMAGCAAPPPEELAVPYEPKIVEPDPPPKENEFNLALGGVPMPPISQQYLSENRILAILEKEARKAGFAPRRSAETLPAGKEMFTLDGLDEGAGVGFAVDQSAYLRGEYDRQRNELSGPSEVCRENFDVIPLSKGYAVVSEQTDGQEVYAFVVDGSVEKDGEEAVIGAFWEFIGWMQWEGLL